MTNFVEEAYDDLMNLKTDLNAFHNIVSANPDDSDASEFYAYFQEAINKFEDYINEHQNDPEVDFVCYYEVNIFNLLDEIRARWLEPELYQ